MDLDLDQRVFLVTGGSRGIGRAGAEALVAEGARVVVSSRSREKVDAAVAALGGGDHALGVAADLAAEDTASRLVQTAYDGFGRLDGALVSVGGPPPGRPTAVSDAQWRESFESVFLGAVRLARVVAERLTDGGSMLFVLSTSVRSPITGLAISNGLRPGLAMLAKDLADELGPRGIRVNALLPGRIATERTLSLDADEQARRGLEQSIPLRRYGEPAEIGRVAAFLLSPAASYVSGAALPVDGGSLRAL